MSLGLKASTDGSEPKSTSIGACYSGVPSTSEVLLGLSSQTIDAPPAYDINAPEKVGIPTLPLFSAIQIDDEAHSAAEDGANAVTDLPLCHHCHKKFIKRGNKGGDGTSSAPHTLLKLFWRVYPIVCIIYGMSYMLN